MNSKAKKFSLSILAASLFLLLSCNDEFLDRFPLDRISSETFWNNGNEVLLYANQFYPMLFDATNAWYSKDNRSDNQVPSRQREVYTWGQYVIPSSGGGWGKADWKPIRDCNFALQNIKNLNDDPDAVIGEAEIRFFKAFFYFEMLKRFGDLPWLDSDLNTDSEDLFKPRDSRSVVVNNILADLNFSINNLPPTSPADRLTKYAALALKVQICLYEGTFIKYHNTGLEYNGLLRMAAEAAESIIDSKLFSVYNTGNPEEDYASLFIQEELKGNPEGILIQRYITDLRTHNNQAQYYQPITGFSQNFVESYLCTDGMPIGLSPLYQGDDQFDNMFVARDPRMKQSVYNSNQPWLIYNNGDVSYKEMPEFDVGTFAATSYLIIKGKSPYDKDNKPLLDVIDNFIFRYGRVLLDYAEAKAELGECTQDVLDNSINLLRERVGMPYLNVDVGFTDPNWPDWEIPISPLLNEIRRERRVETAVEGGRWDDIVRWKAGRLLENPKTILGARDPATGDYRIVYNGSPSNRTWSDKLYLFPLPSQEITLNPNLKQNVGW